MVSNQIILLLMTSIDVIDVASKTSIELLEILINAKADINKTNSNGQTPLHLAVRNNDHDMVSFLIDHGANVNAIDSWGDTVLNDAIYKADKKLITMLLETRQIDIVKNMESITERIISLHKSKTKCAKHVRVLELIIKMKLLSKDEIIKHLDQMEEKGCPIGMIDRLKKLADQ